MNLRRRFWQFVLILSTLVFCWLAMMVVHEGGHVIHLLVSGGSVEHVALHPLKISQTVPAANPHPLLTVIGGPMWGILFPLLIWWTVARLVPGRAYLAAFFVGFCLVTNGAYLAGDALVQGGDGRELVQQGVPPWLLMVIGLPGIAAGLWVWNGLGRYFGLGEARGQVSRMDAMVMAVLTVSLVLVELAFAL